MSQGVPRKQQLQIGEKEMKATVYDKVMFYATIAAILTLCGWMIRTTVLDPTWDHIAAAVVVAFLALTVISVGAMITAKWIRERNLPKELIEMWFLDRRGKEWSTKIEVAIRQGERLDDAVLRTAHERGWCLMRYDSI